MAEYTVNDDGQLVDADGNVVMLNDEEVTLTGVQNQEQVNKVVQDRLARQKRELDERIKTLETQANKTPELESMLEDLRAEKDLAEAELAKAKEKAEHEVAEQLADAKKRALTAEDVLKIERKGRIQDQIKGLILSNAGDLFINPAADIVPKLLHLHKRELAKDAQGNTIEGEFVDLFKVAFENDQGEEVRDYLPVDAALEVLASKEENQHYVRATNSGGAGGGQYTDVSNQKRSEMTDDQKSEFVEKHGLETFQALPS